MASFIFGFGVVTAPVSATFGAMKGLYLTISALVISLLLLKQKYYWLLILGCAVVAAVLIQLLIVSASLLFAADFSAEVVSVSGKAEVLIDSGWKSISVGEYSLWQYEYAKDYSKLVLKYLEVKNGKSK